MDIFRQLILINVLFPVSCALHLPRAATKSQRTVWMPNLCIPYAASCRSTLYPSLLVHPAYARFASPFLPCFQCCFQTVALLFIASGASNKPIPSSSLESCPAHVVTCSQRGTPILSNKCLFISHCRFNKEIANTFRHLRLRSSGTGTKHTQNPSSHTPR
ncbi:hypothetical protein DM02DRAFT_178570 [Periconia macrospinosa]|uniref:Secreted protein n=1 Tax=Periconia macrospinosa TaxID=97972 RepID=A0A2V1E1R9_9PLEO|nr:hypothetical protein DM02DRAFT_178570 [Periconia macrospinosa]